MEIEDIKWPLRDTKFLFNTRREFRISKRPCNVLFIIQNTNELPNHFTLTVFWCERRDLLCSHSNGDIFTCEDNMLFSHVKISSFRAKTHLVFHWCLYNIYIRHLKRTLIGTDPLSFEAGMGDLALKIEFFPDIELCKIFFRSIIRYERYFFSIGIFFLNVFPCKEFFPRN